MVLVSAPCSAPFPRSRLIGLLLKHGNGNLPHSGYLESPYSAFNHMYSQHNNGAVSKYEYLAPPRLTLSIGSTMIACVSMYPLRSPMSMSLKTSISLRSSWTVPQKDTMLCYVSTTHFYHRTYSRFASEPSS